MATRACESRNHQRSQTRHLALVTLIAVTAAACGSTSSSTSVTPTPVRCAVSATANPSTIPAGGGSGSLVISSARECSWSASSQVPWISLPPPTEGQGDGQVRYVVAPNPTVSERRGMLVVGSQSAEIAQQASVCSFKVDRESFEVPAGEQTSSVAVEAREGCDWTARTTVSWITILEGARGTGSKRVRFRIAANSGATPRTGALEVAGMRVEVRQLNGPLAPIDPLDPPCRYDLNPGNAEAGPEQSEGSVSVLSDPGCAWAAVSDQAWLTVLKGRTGKGDGQVQYRALANSTTAARTGHITVAGAVFSLRQAACSYSIAPTSKTFRARGGESTIDVQTQSPCTWSAKSSHTWIDVKAGATGSGDGHVDFIVNANQSLTPRTGFINVAGLAFTVSQGGGTTLSGTVSSVKGSCPDKSFTVKNQRVRTTKSTDYEKGDCGDIRNDAKVDIEGILGRDGILWAFDVSF